MNKAIRLCYINYHMLLEIHEVFNDFPTKYSYYSLLTVINFRFKKRNRRKKFRISCGIKDTNREKLYFTQFSTRMIV